ncbi:hypothetical protein C0995_010878 [Termitomyces sp. Mi166|nr:hypothetical protein C0995_010878 [Termitomyces sp. Mi166\
MTRTEAHINDDLTKSISDSNLSRTTDLLDEWATLFPSNSPPFHSLLALASQVGSGPIASLLLSRGAHVDITAIVSAFSTSESSTIAVFQAFVDSGFNINSNLGHIGDILILSLNSPAVVSWALAHGANPNLHRSNSRSVLDLAVINASINTAEALIVAGARIKNTNALKVAAYYGRLPMIELLLKHGAEVNEIPDYPEMANSERDHGLGTALHEAAEHGQVSAVRLLLKNGADKALKNSRGKTALDLAREGGHPDVAKVLA